MRRGGRDARPSLRDFVHATFYFVGPSNGCRVIHYASQGSVRALKKGVPRGVRRRAYKRADVNPDGIGVEL